MAPRRDRLEHIAGLPGEEFGQIDACAVAGQFTIGVNNIFDKDPPTISRVLDVMERNGLIRTWSDREIAPGIRVVQNISPTREFGETPELSLAIETPSGQVLLVGCSHPGIERILESVHPALATAADARSAAPGAGPAGFHMVVGGLHLVTTTPENVDALVARLRERWGVRSIAPGHCSGEHAFLRLKAAFATGYVFAGVGEVIPLP